MAIKERRVKLNTAVREQGIWSFNVSAGQRMRQENSKGGAEVLGARQSETE